LKDGHASRERRGPTLAPISSVRYTCAVMSPFGHRPCLRVRHDRVLSFVRIILVLLASLPASAHGGDKVELIESAGEALPSPVPASVWIAAATTGGLATTTTVLGLAVLDLRSEFDRANRDPRQSVEARTNLRDMTLEMQHIATIAGLATIAAAATAIVLYFTRPTPRTPAAVLALRIAGETLLLSGTF
jgi:hypothetical protein